MKNKILQIAILLLLPGIPLVAQDIHFSQMFETPLLRNPALAGIFSGDLRVQSVYRSQWNSITNAYQTVSANIEYKLPVGSSEDYLTIAGQALYDKAGDADLKTTQLLPAINYHKSLSADRNTYLSLAFMGGIVQRSVDPSKMTTNSQYNGSAYDAGLATGEVFTKNAYHYLDGSAGISFNSQLGNNEDNNLYAGVAYHHFNRAKKITFYTDSDIEMQPKWVGSAGIRVNMTDYAFFTVEADYTKQGVNSEILGGVLYSMKLDAPEEPKYLVHFGAYIRAKDALIPVAKVEVRPLAVAVSYDVNISTLKKVSTGRGGFEISLTYQKYIDKYNSSRDALRCPKF